MASRESNSEYWRIHKPTALKLVALQALVGAALAPLWLGAGTITLRTFAEGQVAQAADVNANFADVRDNLAGLKLYSAVITNNGAATVIQEDGGDWISNVSRTSAGRVEITYSGCANPPVCSVNTNNGSGGDYCHFPTPHTATLITARCHSAGGGFSDEDLQIVCACNHL